MEEFEPKTKKQLIAELIELHQKYAQLEKAEFQLRCDQKELRETFDSINDAITIHDKNFAILRVNKSAENLFGLPYDKIKKLTCFELYHGTDTPPHDCPCYVMFKSGAATTIEKFEPHLNKHVEIKVIPHFEGKEISKIVHIVTDITERKQIDDKLKQSEEKYRSILETTDDSIYIVDNECRYIYINRKHQVRLGISDDAYIGKTYADYHTSEETQWFSEKIQRAFESGKARQYEHMSKRDNNHFILTLSPVWLSDGEIFAVSVISKNVTEIKQMQDKLRILTITDDLTSLYNRRGFFSLAEHQLKISARLKKGFFLLYADIDNLKYVNDKFGHGEGDQLIIKAADVLKESFRNSDIIARIGGDEFIIFPVEAAEGSTDAVLNRFQESIDRINEGSAHKYPLSLSIGKAYYDPSNPCSVEELLQIADSSMYEVKASKNKSK